eukprot:CAMPEP_0114134296 /NCGR_PEP_ID=MMETSP0043_2-20121206/14078_1 /TAXON_ID=464988 /ORGANISM="Hemiselmis andersenii, Strain CCMP644" /LENGTH=273 /DNA_ID=CAMNT_0001227919 /DNA_START=238 /DNA_END=1062 /DNA_ORIENTATION=+
MMLTLSLLAAIALPSAPPTPQPPPAHERGGHRGVEPHPLQGRAASLPGGDARVVLVERGPKQHSRRAEAVRLGEGEGDRLLDARRGAAYGKLPLVLDPPVRPDPLEVWMQTRMGTWGMPARSRPLVHEGPRAGREIQDGVGPVVPPYPLAHLAGHVAHAVLHAEPDGGELEAVVYSNGDAAVTLGDVRDDAPRHGALTERELLPGDAEDAHEGVAGIRLDHPRHGAIDEVGGEVDLIKQLAEAPRGGFVPPPGCGGAAYDAQPLAARGQRPLL